MIKVMAESEDVSSGTTVSFNPPVYMQRYDAVLNLSDKQKPKKVADVGCGECKLLRRLKSHWNIESLIGVDIDGELLRAHRRSLQPLIADHLIRRPNPLVVQLFKGLIKLYNSVVMVIHHLPQVLLMNAIVGYLDVTYSVALKLLNICTSLYWIKFQL
jgi:SAM-dependent methyltransferase